MIILSIIYMIVVALPLIGMVYLYIKSSNMSKEGSSWFAVAIKNSLAIKIISILLGIIVSVFRVFVSSQFTGGQFMNYNRLLTYVSDYIIFPLTIIAVLIIIVEVFKNRKRGSYD